MSLPDLNAVFPHDTTPGKWDGESGQLDDALEPSRRSLAARCEDSLERNGWYGTEAKPYDYPTTPIDAPRLAKPPVVKAIRGLWLAKFNPASEEWKDPETGQSTSDVANEALFPWSHPSLALREGNFWLSTLSTPANRIGIEAVEVGDLILIQRMNPKHHPELQKGYGAADVIIGVAIAAGIDDWYDSYTERRERRVSLQPAARFKYPVPRHIARKHRRMVGGAFQRMPQRPDGSGQPGFTLSAIPLPEAPEALAVCGISPEALGEPNLGRLAARLRATAQGNKAFWDYRWDHVLQHALRRKHEQEAIDRCRSWAHQHQLLFRKSAEYEKNAGYDLLFIDGHGKHLQVEVKGYSASNLASVHLQPSQQQRAREVTHGILPDWRLFAVLKVTTPNASEHVLTAQQAVDLIASGGLGVSGSHWQGNQPT